METENTKTDKNYETMLCPIIGFRFFIRKSFKEVEISNEDIDELNKEFSIYLTKKFNDEKLKEFLPKNDLDVALNVDHPLRVNGFHPTIAYHFTEFIKEMKEKIETTL